MLGYPELSYFIFVYNLNIVFLFPPLLHLHTTLHTLAWPEISSFSDLNISVDIDIDVHQTKPGAEQQASQHSSPLWYHISRSRRGPTDRTEARITRQDEKQKHHGGRHCGGDRLFTARL